MPLGGWLLGSFLKDFIGSYAGLISFVVFSSLGIKTLYEAYKSSDESQSKSCHCDRYLCLINLGIATSIDAFLIGIILSLHGGVSFYISLPLIGIVTIMMSYIGCHIGNLANQILNKWSQILAAIILIALAIKSVL